jgi:hypothetical protein
MRNLRTICFHQEDLAGEYSVTSLKMHDQHYVPQMIILTPGRLLSASKDEKSSKYLFNRSDYSYIVIGQ